MKYKELQKIALKQSYEIEKNNFRTILIEEGLKGDYKNEITISETEIGVIDICMSLLFPWDFKIVKAAMDYAETPLDERQEEKRYYLRHKFLEIADCNYLNYDHSLRELNLSDMGQPKSIQTQFTQAEIDEIKEKYDTDLKDFEIIEVTE